MASIMFPPSSQLLVYSWIYLAPLLATLAAALRSRGATMRIIASTPGLMLTCFGPALLIEFFESEIPPQFSLLCMFAMPFILTPITYLTTLSTGALADHFRPARRQRV